MSDPVTTVFGKDVAGLIYRHVFVLQMKCVNEQFLNFLIESNGLAGSKHNSVVFKTVNRGHESGNVIFNYRTRANLNGNPDIYCKSCTNLGWKSYAVRCKLPNNYL